MIPRLTILSNNYLKILTFLSISSLSLWQTASTSNTHTSADSFVFILLAMLLVSITPPERELIAASYSWSKSLFSILRTNDSFRKSSGHFTEKELKSSISSSDVIFCNLEPLEPCMVSIKTWSKYICFFIKWIPVYSYPLIKNCIQV